MSAIVSPKAFYLIRATRDWHDGIKKGDFLNIWGPCVIGNKKATKECFHDSVDVPNSWVTHSEPGALEVVKATVTLETWSPKSKKKATQKMEDRYS